MKNRTIILWTYWIILLLLIPGRSQGQSQDQPATEFKQLNAQGAFLNGEWNSPSSFSFSEEQDEVETDAHPAQLSSQELSLRYMSSQTKWKDGHFILEAYEMNPLDKNIWEEVMEYYGIHGDDASVKVMANKIQSNDLIPARILEYHKLMVSLADENSVILSHGEWDTAALQIAISQSTKKVNVLNVHWLREQAYLDNGLMNVGVHSPAIKAKASDMIKEMLQKNGQVRLHITLSQNKNLLSGLSDRLKLEGLSFRLSDDGQAATRQIQCWKELKAKQPFKDPAFNSEITYFELNYLPILVSMENYALTNGVKSDADWARKWMNELTKRAGMEPLAPSKIKKN